MFTVIVSTDVGRVQIDRPAIGADVTVYEALDVLLDALYGVGFVPSSIEDAVHEKAFELRGERSGRVIR